MGLTIILWLLGIVVAGLFVTICLCKWGIHRHTLDEKWKR